MIKKYDELELEISKVAGSDMAKAKELSSQKTELLSKMPKEDIEELLKRPYPSQYKEILKQFL